jgi:hypothetical protein
MITLRAVVIRNPAIVDFSVRDLATDSIGNTAEDCVGQTHLLHLEIIPVDGNLIANAVGLFEEDEKAGQQELCYDCLKCEA